MVLSPDAQADVVFCFWINVSLTRLFLSQHKATSEVFVSLSLKTDSEPFSLLNVTEIC